VSTTQICWLIIRETTQKHTETEHNARTSSLQSRTQNGPRCTYVGTANQCCFEHL